MKKQQTAVEFLVQELGLDNYLLGSYEEEIEQARLIEKNQLERHYLIGSIVGILAGIAIGWFMFS